MPAIPAGVFDYLGWSTPLSVGLGVLTFGIGLSAVCAQQTRPSERAALEI